MKTEKIIVNGKEQEIYVSIPKEEVEDNSDLFDLDQTQDLSGVINNG